MAPRAGALLRSQCESSTADTSSGGLPSHPREGAGQAVMKTLAKDLTKQAIRASEAPPSSVGSEPLTESDVVACGPT